MNVLLTGALGNLGVLVLGKLIAAGHNVTGFDIYNKANENLAKPFVNTANIVWGDIRDSKQVEELVAGQDAIIHLAAILYPFTEENSELTQAVNVLGTQTLLRAAEQSLLNPVFVFSSSIAVFGLTQDKPPPRNHLDTIEGTDNYSTSKVESEKMIQASSANWVIMRIGGMVDSRMRHSDKEQMKLAFLIAADNRIEFIHPKDAAVAFVNAISRPEALQKVLLIGGGKSCQVTHYDFVNVMSEGMGLNFPKSYFGSQQLYTDWLDTEASQAVLNFQNHSFDDLRQECNERFKWLRNLVKPLAPILRLVVKFYLK